REEAKSRGRAAKRDIETNYSEEKIAGLIQQRLGVVRERDRLAEFRKQIQAFHSSYRALIDEIKALAEMLPSDAVVIVVSKGDDELLKLGSRRALHFPQTDAGTYAGFHPADGRAAIEHLEQVRAKGGN